MHGYVDAAEFLEDVSVFLGCYYVVVALMNGIAAFYLWKTARAATYCRLGRWSLTSSHLWLLVAALFTTMAIVVLIAMTVIGRWVAAQIEVGVVHSTSAATALYMDAVLAPVIGAPIASGLAMVLAALSQKKGVGFVLFFVTGLVAPLVALLLVALGALIANKLYIGPDCEPAGSYSGPAEPDDEPAAEARRPAWSPQSRL